MVAFREMVGEDGDGRSVMRGLNGAACRRRDRGLVVPPEDDIVRGFVSVELEDGAVVAVAVSWVNGTGD